MPVRSIDRITIPEPCNADWDSMIGNDQVRFCEHCNLHVTDLSALTRPQAMRLVARSQGRLCVRFIQRPDGGVLTRAPEKLYRIGRRTSRIAAGAFTATLSLASAAGQAPRSGNSGVTQVTQAKEQNRIKAGDVTAGLWGAVVDPQGAVVPGATLKLTNNETGSEHSVTSSDEGVYSFQSLSPGSYTLSVWRAGFNSLEINEISLSANASEHLDTTLDVGGISLGGAIAFVAPEEPLVKAVFDNDLEAVEQLAFSTADVNVRDKGTNMTALEHAVENGNLEIVHTLLIAGARVNLKSESGRTALMLLRESATDKLVRELLSAGAKVNARDESGRTALINAASSSNYAAVKELLDNGAKVDLKDEDGKTALMCAADNDDPRIAKLLIDAGAAVNAQDKEGKTALMIAAEEGDPETVKLLLSFNADVNARDDNGSSALMLAAGTRDVVSVEALLNAGADVTFKDHSGKTALGLARENDKDEIAKLLESRGAPE
jgi:ankyrin repeat protein